MGEQAAEDRIWKSRRVQLQKDVDCGCQGVDVANVNVVVLSFDLPPVSQVQQLLGKECTVRQKMSCGGKVSQEVSARDNQLRREATPICLQLECQHFGYNLPRHPWSSKMF